MQLREAHAKMILRHADIINQEISNIYEKVIEIFSYDDKKLVGSRKTFEVRINLLITSLTQLETHLIELHPEEKDNLKKRFQTILDTVDHAWQKISLTTHTEFHNMMKELLTIRPTLMQIVGDEVGYHHEQGALAAVTHQSKEAPRKIGPMSFYATQP